MTDRQSDQQSFIERVLRSIESHIEEWREQDKTRRTEVEANRQKLWEEATERERLLQEAINDEESKELSPEEVAKEQRVVFVVHSEEAAKALEEFASDEVRLASVVPGRGGYSRETGVKGSWLVFERAG